jgi:hypothetical protein
MNNNNHTSSDEEGRNDLDTNPYAVEINDNNVNSKDFSDVPMNNQAFEDQV